MKKSKKLVGIAAVMAVIVSLLVVSVPAKESEGAEKYSPKIPEEKREWMAREEKKIQGELKDPEFLKKLERSKNRKWYSYEELYGKDLDEEDREYIRILKRMEREGIDTTKLFEEIEERTIGRYVEAWKRREEYFPEEFDKIQFAKEFEKRKLKERKGSVNIEKENKANGNFDLDMRPLRGDVNTDVIFYIPYNQFAHVKNNDNAKFYLEETDYAGTAVWVHMKPGAPVEWIDYTWLSYYDPTVLKNYVLDDIATNNPEGVTLDDVNDVHIKYFIQASTVRYMYHYPEQEFVYLRQGGSFKKVELWSEATYYLDSGSWIEYGYPRYAEGGARTIEQKGYTYTSTGNAYYRTPSGSPSYYPKKSSRNFGGGSQTHIILHLESHPLHQQAVLS